MPIAPPKHGRAPAARRHEQKRDTAADRGYDARWRKARAAFLRAHPVCLECEAEGKLIAATVVDHVVPHKGDASRFWDRTNWQPLCKAHHDRKTAAHDGGFGRAASPGRGVPELSADGR